MSTELTYHTEYYREARVQTLRAQGHRCILYLETWPARFGWCGAPFCLKSS